MFNRSLTLSLFGGIALFGACAQAEQQLPPAPYPAGTTTVAEELPYDESDPWVKDNFDLSRAGDLLRKSKSPAEFEAYLNEPNGINNLDLNGDGYVDYISVEEFEDRGDGQRGLSLLARYGPDIVQNIASIFLYRDEPRYPGARVLLRGDEVLYGDNNYYETNWLDQTLGIVSVLFSDRDRYVSPYYYDRYPPGYAVYEVVETPYYRARVERMWPQPIFAYTAATPVYYDRIKIKSPNNGRHLGQIYGRPMKPTKEQIAFRKTNPVKKNRDPQFQRDGGPRKQIDPPGQREDPPGKNKDVVDGPATDKGRGNPGGPPKFERDGGPRKPDNPGVGQNKGGGPDKVKSEGKNKGNGKGKP